MQKTQSTSVMSLIFSGLLATQASAQEMDHSNHADHASHSDHSGHAMHDTSSGLHTHHAHEAGSWMLEYQFMRMDMDGMIDGKDDVSSTEVTAMPSMGGYGYMMTPESMTMDMHMFMLMYGMTDRVSLMGMFNYLDNSMDMITRAGLKSTMSTSGVSDTLLGAMYQVNPALTLSLGLSIPTGSIEETGDMVMDSGTMQDVTLPYPMQLGSGTYDFVPSATYNGQYGDWAFGGQASYTFRTGENDRDYTFGDRAEGTIWLKRSLSPTLVVSSRLGYARWGNIDGMDKNILIANTMGMKTSPTSDPNLQGGSRIDLLLGISAMFGQRSMLGLEFGVPLMQDLDGPQMQTDRIISISYQYSPAL